MRENSTRGEGNYAAMGTLNSGAAAARRYTMTGTSGMVKVRHDGLSNDPIFVGYEDLTGANYTTAAKIFYADGEADVLDVALAENGWISLYCATDTPSLLICEVR